MDKDKEWSGFLFYEVTTGNIGIPSELELTVRGIYLLDIGTSGYTEFSAKDKILDVYDAFPQLMDNPEVFKLGKVHSHHNMNAYHSGTDVQDLHDHAQTHAYYVSLVVNYDGKYDCEIGVFCKEADRRLIHKDGAGGEVVSVIKGEERLMRIKCNITKPRKVIKVPEHITEQFLELSTPVREINTRVADTEHFTPQELREFLCCWITLNAGFEGTMIEALRTLEDPDDIYAEYSHEQLLVYSFESQAKAYFDEQGSGSILPYLEDLAEEVLDFLDEPMFADYSEQVEYLKTALETTVLAMRVTHE